MIVFATELARNSLTTNTVCPRRFFSAVRVRAAYAGRYVHKGELNISRFTKLYAVSC